MINKKGFIPVAFLSLLTVALFFPNIFLGKTFFLRDITYIFHPWKAFASEMLQSGRMPLWNPYAYCGMPFLANWQSAVFYPFSLLFYFFHFPAALKLFHFFHIFLAGFFAYLFGRKQGLSAPAAAAIMLAFAFNGYIITRTEFLSHLSVDAWLFLVLLLVRSPVPLTLALSVSFLGGHQIFFVQLLGLLIFFLFNLDGSVKIKAYALPAALFACLVSVQLLPTAALAGVSARVSRGLDFSVATLHSVKLTDLPGLISRAFQAAPHDIINGEYFSWVNTFNIGILGFILAVLGLPRSFSKKPSDKRKLAAVTLVLAGLFFSLGANNPLFSALFKNLPFFNAFRYPVQFMYLTVAGLAMLSGWGMERIKYRAVFLVLFAAELLITNSGSQILAPNDYFYKKPPTAAFLQQAGGGERFILSPGTETNRYIPGADIAAAWENARGYLFNLTCMPFHLFDAYGFGEPLVPAPAENFVNAAYNFDTPQKSYPFFAKMGVKYLICRNRLPDERHFGLLTNSSPFIYRLDGNISKYDFAGNARVIAEMPGKITLNIQTAKSARPASQASLVWKESYYAGWQAYAGSKILKIEVENGLFRKIMLPGPGDYNVYQIFNPSSFKYGLLITLFGICSLIAYCVFKLRRTVK